MINKTIKAFFLGYIKFEVNGKVFFRYNAAQKFTNELKTKNISICFIGLNIFCLIRDIFFLPETEYINRKGYRGFFVKSV